MFSYLLRDRSISIVGWARAQRGWVTMFSAFPMRLVMLFSVSGRGGSSYFKPCILKYCKLPKSSVSLGAWKSLQNLLKTCRKRPFEQTEPYKLNFGSLQYYCSGNAELSSAVGAENYIARNAQISLFWRIQANCQQRDTYIVAVPRSCRL